MSGSELAQGVQKVRALSLVGDQECCAARVDQLVADALRAGGSSSGARLSAVIKVLDEAQKELQDARDGHGSVNFPAGDFDADGYPRVLDSVKVRVDELVGLVNQGVVADDVLESLKGRPNGGR